ncbi:MAG: nitroreductase family protein [Betaproteobacteria bacterium]|jgi:ferredoxin|nr:nitroreductase family protein [Betaproteobacteria bacterium]
MAIPTSRVKGKAQIHIDTAKCDGCGKCIEVCKDFGLELVDEHVPSAVHGQEARVVQKARIKETSFAGCIACGHCMAVCPWMAITINGRTLSQDDLFKLPTIRNKANYEQLMALLQRRRSIREFTDKKVEPEIIKKILEAAVTSPMGIPPSDVNVLVFDTKEKNHQFAKDYCEFLKSIRWFVSRWFLALMRPFWGKETNEMFHNFIKPLFGTFTGEMEKGFNVVSYDAPLMIYFYGSPYVDPADPIVAATTAMYAAESLGLGSCMLGGIHPMIQYGGKAKQFREKYGIRYTSREGLFVIFGYPSVRYRKGLKRTFASVTYSK